MINRVSIHIVMVLLIIHSFSFGQDSTTGLWLVGYAETDITPSNDQEVQMSGYGRERDAHGSVMPLISQVVVLRDLEGNTGIFIAADIVAFDRVFVNAIRHSIYKKHHISEENILLVASHTHWGPAVRLIGNFSTGAPNVWYNAWLEEKIIDQVDRALAGLSPASIEYTSFDFCEIASNRRLFVDGEILMKPNPEGSFDGHIPLIRIKRDAHPQQILMVGYASHVTGSGAIEKWSPGYPGSMRNYLSGALQDTKAVFIQGCGGDAKITYTDPKTGKLVFSSDTIHSREAGEKLAKAVLTHLESHKMTVIDNKLACSLVTGQLSYGQRWPQEEIEHQAYDGKVDYYLTWSARQSLAYPVMNESFRYDAQVWKLGNQLTIFGMEDEVCSPWGKILRSMATTKQALVAGYANNTSCYIPDNKMVGEGGYEVIRSQQYSKPGPYTQNIETEIKAIVRKALKALD